VIDNVEIEPFYETVPDVLDWFMFQPYLELPKDLPFLDGLGTGGLSGDFWRY